MIILMQAWDMSYTVWGFDLPNINIEIQILVKKKPAEAGFQLFIK